MTDYFLIGKILIVGGAGFNLRISNLATFNKTSSQLWNNNEKIS
jgi:hypothetical protein